MALFGAGSASVETVPLVAAAALGTLAWASARPDLRAALRDLRFVASLGLMLFVFQALDFDSGVPAFDPDGAASALRSLARICGGYGAARAFYARLGVSRIRDALSRFVRPFARRGEDPVEPLALAIGFVPAVTAAWRATEEAARVRGYGRRLRGGKGPGAGRRLRMLSGTIAAFLRNILLLAREVAEARVARGTGAAPQSLPPFSLSGADYRLLALSATPLALALLY